MVVMVSPRAPVQGMQYVQPAQEGSTLVQYTPPQGGMRAPQQVMVDPAQPARPPQPAQRPAGGKEKLKQPEG
ncbi:unnamed protein product [Amoebophrya sp. A25]|nr:unnamed protein product [Amoebophrya sp. A25]|eukprot:GSA25T00007630001.1